MIAIQPVIVSILRAGIPLFEGLLNYFDRADCGFVGAYRQHIPGEASGVKQTYLTCPDLSGRPLILADPMLATGASLVMALQDLLAHGNPLQIHIVCAIASREGIELISKTYPHAQLWVGAVDEELDSNGFIVPGLGDAGDLCYGQKLQG